MSRAEKDLQVVAALVEAARSTGRGMRTAGRRMGSRAAALGAEGTRRTGLAGYALRGRPAPVPRRRAQTAVVLAAGTAAGAVAALAIRYAVVNWPGTDALAQLTRIPQRIAQQGSQPNGQGGVTQSVRSSAQPSTSA
jgi:hypothetical protein